MLLQIDTVEGSGSSENEHDLEVLSKDLKKKIGAYKKQAEHITQKIEQTSPARLLIGSFLKPDTFFMEGEDGTQTDTTQLIHALHKKEKELQELTHALKTTQALEHARQSEIARQVEEQARKCAEEKSARVTAQARQALEYANHAADDIQHALAQAQRAEDAREEEEKQRKILENKIQQVIKQVNKAENARRLEENARKVAEEKIKYAFEHAAHVEDMYKLISEEKIIKYQTEKKDIEGQLQETSALLEKTEADNIAVKEALMNVEAQTQQLEEEKKEYIERIETLEIVAQKKSDIIEKLTLTIHETHAEKQVECKEYSTLLETTEKANAATIHTLSQQIQICETKNAEQAHAIEEKNTEQAHATEHLKKIAAIVSTERKLRKLYARQARHTVQTLQQLETARSREEQLRKSAEEKTRITLEQASKAMMRVLSDSITQAYQKSQA